jgi:hypothetical protein
MTGGATPVIPLWGDEINARGLGVKWHAQEVFCESDEWLVGWSHRKEYLFCMFQSEREHIPNVLRTMFPECCFRKIVLGPVGFEGTHSKCVENDVPRMLFQKDSVGSCGVRILFSAFFGLLSHVNTCLLCWWLKYSRRLFRITNRKPYPLLHPSAVRDLEWG